MKKLIYLILVLTYGSSNAKINEARADLKNNEAYWVEGSGYNDDDEGLLSGDYRDLEEDDDSTSEVENDIHFLENEFSYKKSDEDLEYYYHDNYEDYEEDDEEEYYEDDQDEEYVDLKEDKSNKLLEEWEASSENKNNIILQIFVILGFVIVPLSIWAIRRFYCKRFSKDKMKTMPFVVQKKDPKNIFKYTTPIIKDYQKVPTKQPL